MGPGRASARHVIDCLRNLLLDEAADALLRVAEDHARRLEQRGRRDGEGALPPDWLDGLPHQSAKHADSPNDRAKRRKALLAALDRTAGTGDSTAGGEHAEPEVVSARLAAAEFGLDALDAAILVLALRCAAGSHLGALADDVHDRLRDPASAVAAMLGAQAHEARRRLAPGAPLLASGLLSPTSTRYPLFGGEFQDGAIAVAESLFRATARAPEGRGPWVETLLGRPTPPELAWGDFSHLAEPADLAARLLRGAAEAGAAGVHVLLHGPVGTGKTRLAASVAARAGLTLYAVGEADEDGDEPSRASRASALRLAMALTARRRDAALLFDEAEDVLEAAPRQAGDARDNRSKNWLNLLLERSPTPVLWTCNDLHRIDPSILRRFSLLIEVDVPREAAVRARVWARAMEGAGLALPEDAAARLAGRWAAAPALCASAALAARLAGGGEAEVEAALSGYARVLGGGAPRPVYRVGDAAAAFDPDLLACDTDIAALGERLAAPGSPEGWALLITGPAGSGRSTVAARLASGLGLPVLRRRAADLTMGAPSEAWRAVAGAFAEARARHAVLLLDGIDRVAAERGAPEADGAALDALLAELDDSRSPVIAVADLPSRLDRAALRRFTLSVRLRALDPRRIALAFRRMLGAEPTKALPDGLTLGDFAAVRLRRDLMGGGADAATLRAWLAERAEQGGALPRKVGFRMLGTGACTGNGDGGIEDDRMDDAAAA